MKFSDPIRRTGLPLILGLLSLLLIETVRLLSGAPFHLLELLLRAIFIACVLLAGNLIQIRQVEENHWRLPWSGVALALAGMIALVVTIRLENILVAWFTLAIFFALLFGLTPFLLAKSPWILRVLKQLCLAAVAGGIPVILTEILGRFSEEEFFVALQAASLASFWFLLSLAFNSTKPIIKLPQKGARISRPVFSIVIIVLMICGLFQAARAYQTSFYPTQAPTFPGITDETPFLCGLVPELPPTTIQSREILTQIVQQLEANPEKTTLDYGELGLLTSSPQWLEPFRQNLVYEAKEGLFTGPANSIKFGQYEAALRAYYYDRIRTKNVPLFSQEEQNLIKSWFQAINQRAFTVEWIDWMYGLAFSSWPEGPYQNQENGLGFLAILEKLGLSDPTLASKNRSYLLNNPGGWPIRFHNTDDAYIYQLEWIINAYFQDQYANNAPLEHVRQSFDWLMLQALPDGRSPQYNHEPGASLANLMLLGAEMLEDPRYLWIAEQSIQSHVRWNLPLYASPTAEKDLDLQGQAPTEGSCLLYSDSGLPNQKGPLAPDKIVFRSGWNADDTYLLLNLRFTGWHRYKATNNIVLIDQAGPMVQEQVEGKPFSWLPVGRSLFRDKRVPRENLNGLLIERQGLSAVLYQLLGFGGPWSQDPPYYATIESFEPGSEMDFSRTLISDWHGWQQQRSIHFYHDGLIFIYDEVQGPSDQNAALSWHLSGTPSYQAGRFQLGSTKQGEMVIIPQPIGNIQFNTSRSEKGSPQVFLQYTSPSGILKMVSIILTKDWIGASVELTETEQGLKLQVSHDGTSRSLSLEGW